MEEAVKVDTTPEDLIIDEKKYEFLDHTADVQIHAWGDSLKEAFEQAAVAMSAYITEIETISIDSVYELEIKADDMLSLLYRYLDEILFLFCAEPYHISRKIRITTFDEENFLIKVRCCGEPFNLDKHPQGTEIKAITYSNMQIHEKDVYVIIDI